MFKTMCWIDLLQIQGDCFYKNSINTNFRIFTEHYFPKRIDTKYIHIHPYISIYMQDDENKGGRPWSDMSYCCIVENWICIFNRLSIDIFMNSFLLIFSIINKNRTKSHLSSLQKSKQQKEQILWLQKSSINKFCVYLFFRFAIWLIKWESW